LEHDLDPERGCRGGNPAEGLEKADETASSRPPFGVDFPPTEL
jgi:hypothetical protein